MTVAKYYVYRNLRTGGFSVRHKGKVIHRLDSLYGIGVEFRVNASGRARVIREKSKNVHAFAVCDNFTVDNCPLRVDKLSVITYNPYKSQYFVCDGAMINSADKVIFYNGKCYLSD